MRMRFISIDTFINYDIEYFTWCDIEGIGLGTKVLKCWLDSAL